MLWGVPIWIWLAFFVPRILLIAVIAVLWVHFFPKVLWNKKIEEKYFGGMLEGQKTEEEGSGDGEKITPI